MKEAVMIVIQRDRTFLLGKRSLAKAKAPGYWCPISGHIEAGESEAQAVVREAQEELGVSVEALVKLGSTQTHDGLVVLHWWRAQILSGEPTVNNEENSEIRWFSSTELRDLSPVYKEDIDWLLRVVPP